MFGAAEAQSIRNAGWRQGSIFIPPVGYSVPVRFDRNREMLIVCTQSCAVVSRQLEANPLIEFIVAEPVEKYHANSPEATGRNLRCFHLPIGGLPNTEALACDFNRRFFADRRDCLKCAPNVSVQVREEHSRNLAGWIARNYTRIALPDSLVERAKGGLFKILVKALRKKNLTGEALSASIERILISFSPESEVLSGTYDVYLIFLCADVDTDVLLHSFLDEELEKFTLGVGQDGILLTYECKVSSETFVSELKGYRRLTEWDYLSSLGDVAEHEN